jgi:hypothetical protein
VLSTGQQFRVTLARVLAESQGIAVIDEFTSVVDRTVAQVGSAALARTIRQRGQRFIAVTCHEDVEAWLNPDWVYRPAENHFSWRLLQRRPPVTFTVVRASPSAWQLFAPHHYLSHTLAPGAWCFLAHAHNKPMAFSAWLPFFGAGPLARREHRTVCLPDYQGVGVGNALSDAIASLWTALGYRARSTTTHPAMIASRLRSPHWTMTREQSLGGTRDTKLKHATNRLTAGFEYIGPPMNRRTAELLLNG